jgi:hypothetical protein
MLRIAGIERCRLTLSGASLSTTQPRPKKGVSMAIEEFVRKVHASADPNDIPVDRVPKSIATTRDVDTSASSIACADGRVSG